MTAFHFLLDLLLLLVILGGALPFSFSLLIDDRDPHHTVSLAHFLLVLLTAWSVAQVGLGLFLGMLGQLKLGSVVLAELLFFVLGIVLIISKPKHNRNNLFKIAFSSLKQINRIELFLLYSIGLTGLFLFVTLITKPVIDYDSLWFHLPAIVRWYQAHSLTLLDSTGNWIFQHPAAAEYPYNWHILSLLCLMPLRTDVLVTLPSFLAWVMLGLSVYLLSREFGADRFYGIAATGLFLSMPFVMNRVNTAQADLPLAAMFMVSLYFAYSCHKTRSPVEFFLFMASVGVLSGIKTPGIFYGVLVGGCWAVSEIFRRFQPPQSVKRASLRKTGFAVLGWVALIFLGGYWYVHHSSEKAIALSDLFSITVASAELSSLPKPSVLATIFEKLNEYQKSTLTHQFNPSNLAQWKVLILQVVSRFQLPFIALTLQIILLPYVWLRYPKSCYRRPFIYALVLLFLSGFLYWNTPYSSGTAGLVAGELGVQMGNNMRYGFPFVAMGAVMATVVATVLKTSRRLVVAIVWLSGLLSILSVSMLETINDQIFMGQRQMRLGQLIEQGVIEPLKLVAFGLHLLQQIGMHGFVLALIYAVSSLWILRHKGLDTWVVVGFPRRRAANQSSTVGTALLRSALASVVLVGLLVSVGGQVRYQSQATLYQGLYEYLEQTVGANHKIAYFSSPYSYLLYGRRFEQIVLCRATTPNNPQRWLDGLHQEGVEFVAVEPGRTTYQTAEGRFLQHFIQRGLLKTDFGQDLSKKFVIFRVQPETVDR